MWNIWPNTISNLHIVSKYIENIDILNAKNNDRKFIFFLFQCSDLIISYHRSKNKSFKVVMSDRWAPYQDYKHQTSTTHGTYYSWYAGYSCCVLLSLQIKLNCWYLTCRKTLPSMYCLILKGDPWTKPPCTVL